jgi:uncharacterized protein YecT (DUF1311 family)
MADHSVPVAGEEATSLFIGKNHEYFKRKWKIAEGKKDKQSWNWAALILGFSWMAYRKMYLYSFTFIGAVLIEQLCEYAFSFPDKISNAINIAIAIAFGKFGNYLYMQHVEKKVKEICALNSPDHVNQELAKQGGTNIGAAFGFVAAFVAIEILVAIVARPNQDLSEGEANQPVLAQSSTIEAQPPTIAASVSVPAAAPALPQVAAEPPPQQPVEATQTIAAPISTGSFAPSFDCAKTSTAPERLICSSRELSALDVELSQQYKRLLNISTNKDSLKKEQNEWRKTQRDACSTAECIEVAYKNRIEDLESTSQYLSKPAQFR